MGKAEQIVRQPVIDVILGRIPISENRVVKCNAPGFLFTIALDTIHCRGIRGPRNSVVTASDSHC
jgi:hypothetical protein